MCINILLRHGTHNCKAAAVTIAAALAVLEGSTFIQFETLLNCIVFPIVKISHAHNFMHLSDCKPLPNSSFFHNIANQEVLHSK